MYVGIFGEISFIPVFYAALSFFVYAACAGPIP